MTEEWRPVPDFEGAYEVSSEGKARSLPRWKMHRGFPARVPGKTLKPVYISTGYKTVHFYRAGRSKQWKIHQLVASVFIGPRPPGAVIRHLDGDKDNNAADNLAYGTYSENGLDAVAHGGNANANKTHCKYGHPLTGENLRVSLGRNRREYRNCRTCDRRRNNKTGNNQGKGTFDVASD